VDRYQLSERDICTKFITPALQAAGWQQAQFREEVSLTDGRVMVRGRMAMRIRNPEAKGGPKRADYVLYASPNVPLAVVEAKQARFPVGQGMQQALAYADMLDAPFAISSNGTALLVHDRTGLTSPTEREVPLDAFPTHAELWALFQQWKGLTEPAAVALVEQPFYTDGSGREPRYYQRVAINRAIETIAKGQQRVLLVMATGTGKTYTAFQIIWRLWKAKAKKRILFLADRNILVDQTMQQDFAPFGEVMHKVTNREVKKNYEVYLALYQAVTGREEWKQIYRQFPADFFDLVVIDECHRGSAADDSAWRDVLDYFSAATHLGLTATPKETKEVSNLTYFGDPVYTYSLKQGIEDGFLAPYKVKDGHDGNVSSTQLSEGELQMLTVLGLMRITREDHCLFLLDEPDTHLNPIWKLRYFDDIEGVLNQDGEALMQGASQVLITTHDPMMVGSLMREQVHILRREGEGTVVQSPYEHPQGMGVAGLLKSELFGLPSTLDPQTLDDLQRRNELIAKQASEGLTADEGDELQCLRRYIEELGFSREYRDPMYQLFIEKMYRAKSQPINKLLTPQELAEQEALAESIIKELVVSERKGELAELARQLRQGGV
jgi:uncharacterized protein YnzC (UPF0291/DUF896 family)